MKSSARAVVDTNVLISAALSKGAPRRSLLRVVREGILLQSRDTFSEFETRIRRPKFDPYLSHEDRDEYIAWVLARAEFIVTTEQITACRDPKDDKFLELAVSGLAGVIISGDEDLRVLHPFRGIPILTPDEFLRSRENRGEE